MVLWWNKFISQGCILWTYQYEKQLLLFLEYYRIDSLYPCREQRIYTVGNDISGVLQNRQFISLS